MKQPVDNFFQSAHTLRVLLVENNPGERQDFEELLSDWGYTVYSAKGFGQSLIDDAKAQAKKYGCHVALIDMRLLDDYDPQDMSGLNLVPQLEPTISVMLSAHGDVATARAAINDKKAHSFVGKQEAPDVLAQAIQEAAQRVHAGRDDLVITWPYGLSSPEITRRLIPEDPDVPFDEVHDLVGRLFPEAHTLKLEVLSGTSRTPSIAPRQRSIVLKVWEDDLQPVVAKIARGARISKESQNYDQYVRDRLVGRFYARLQRPIPLWRLGGAVYDFMGTSLDSMETFSEYYVAQPAIKIQRSLNTFFGITWAALYSKTVKPQKVSLFKAYSQVWGDEWHQRLRDFLNQETSLRYTLISTSVDLPNPVVWVLKRVGLDTPSTGDASDLPEMYTAVTHGDLLGDNIFVDQHGEIWIIDYERTGDGPILQDFVELETDILTRLVDTQSDDLDSFVKLYVPLLKLQELGKRSPIMPNSSGQLSKALRVIGEIRKLAREQTKVRDARQYLWGLLLNTVFRLTLLHDSSDPKRERILLLGSLICHRLEHWNEQWPPNEWSLTGGDKDSSQCPPGESRHRRKASQSKLPLQLLHRSEQPRNKRVALNTQPGLTGAATPEYKTIQLLRVVVASPGDVQAERDCLEDVAAELNHGIATAKGLRIEIARWETDAFPGFHVDGPQGLIDSILKIEDCDVLIGIFWKRFGTPVADANSGTEHEFRLAYNTWKQRGRPQIMMYFNQKSYMPKSSAETTQQSQVLQFKEGFPEEGLWWPYNSKVQFKDLVRNHLTHFILQTYP